MRIGSWTYNREELNLVHGHSPSLVEELEDEDGKKVWHVANAIDLDAFYPSVEWNIMAVPGPGLPSSLPTALRRRVEGKRREGHYPCCPHTSGFVDITYYVELRRKTGFYVSLAPFLASGTLQEL